ncbi:MAG: class I SAM-dependent methyltransferase [Candidatus Azambacteria bacterium]|nr:class I SAM-dependent methyltransferase [Candidatus Azambacteria bacterium]
MKKLSHYINRSKSVVTGKENLEHLYALKDFPVFFGCVDTPRENDFLADMEWAIDPESGVIQLTKLIPLEILYKEQHVDGYGATWERYYDAFADYIVRQDPISVLEIGGGAGKLADAALKKSKELIWTIVEPNPIIKETEHLKVIHSFFDENFIYDGFVDTVVFSQVLEHAYDPKKFIKHIAKFLKPGGKLIFAYPQLALWLSRKYTNAINFEHSMLLTEHHLDMILPELGFLVSKKEKYEDHSFFYVAERSTTSPPIPALGNKYKEYKKVFLDFINYHINMVKDLNEKITTSKEPVYLFGAHIFSSYLINFGLHANQIVTVLDNSPLKQGKRLYGTDFIVTSPKILKDKGQVNVILKAGIYNEEIKKDILENINSDVIFW